MRTNAMRKAVKKGISVCIFINSWDLYQEVEKLHQCNPFNKIIELANYPIIPVKISKGEKHPRFQFLKRLMRKYRVPASIAFGRIVYQGHDTLLKSKHELELCFEE